jgi:hypothetical protein
MRQELKIHSIYGNNTKKKKKKKNLVRPPVKFKGA